MGIMDITSTTVNSQYSDETSLSETGIKNIYKGELRGSQFYRK